MMQTMKVGKSGRNDMAPEPEATISSSILRPLVNGQVTSVQHLFGSPKYNNSGSNLGIGKKVKVKTKLSPEIQTGSNHLIGY